METYTQIHMQMELRDFLKAQKAVDDTFKRTQPVGLLWKLSCEYHSVAWFVQ